jgi:hypothetical protein
MRRSQHAISSAESPGPLGPAVSSLAAARSQLTAISMARRARSLNLTVACRLCGRPISAGLNGLIWTRRPSLGGCDCGFDVVEECLKCEVVMRLDPLTPDRLVLADYAALDRVADNGGAIRRY